MTRWGFVILAVLVSALVAGQALASPPPWANAGPKKTTTTRAATTTTVAPTTTTLAPTTTTVGPTTTTVPSSCVGVTVTPADNLQALIDTNPTGTTFCLQAGDHRPASQGGYTPKTGDVLVGVGANAHLNGAKVITGWAPSGSDWVAAGFLPSSGSTAGQCATGTPLCGWAQDVFLDGAWLPPVASRAALAPGRVFPDFANNRLYVRDDPTGRLVEQSWATPLLSGTNATGVQVRNLGIHHAASEYQHGAIDPGSGSTGWTLDHLEVSRNHGYGVGPGADTGLTLTASHVHDNGEIGTGGDGPNVVVIGNEVDHNNYAGYNAANEGGNKFGHTQHMVVRGNYYHDNEMGIWCDINCRSALIEDNYVSGESNTGIFYEVSCGETPTDPAVIRNNTVVSSGNAIQISGSKDVEVYGNQTYDNHRAIWAFDQHRTDSLGYCASIYHEVKNLYVHDNSEDLNGPFDPAGGYGGETGLWTDTGDANLYTPAWNNRFVGNTYHDTSPGTVFDWGVSGQYTTQLTWAQWQAAGQDATGSFPADDPAAPPPPVLIVGPQP